MSAVIEHGVVLPQVLKQHYVSQGQAKIHNIKHISRNFPCGEYSE
jgi:hypothetical protein